jgi:hypothetical protein
VIGFLLPLHSRTVSHVPVKHTHPGQRLVDVMLPRLHRHSIASSGDTPHCSRGNPGATSMQRFLQQPHKKMPSQVPTRSCPEVLNLLLLF